MSAVNPRRDSDRFLAQTQHGHAESRQAAHRGPRRAWSALDPDDRRRIALEVADPLRSITHRRDDHGVANAGTGQRHLTRQATGAASGTDDHRAHTDRRRSACAALDVWAHDAVDRGERVTLQGIQTDDHGPFNSTMTTGIPAGQLADAPNVARESPLGGDGRCSAGDVEMTGEPADLEQSLHSSTG